LLNVTVPLSSLKTKGNLFSFLLAPPIYSVADPDFNRVDEPVFGEDSVRNIGKSVARRG